MTKIYLKTERLFLRPIELSDLEAIHQLHSLPETDKFNTLGIPQNTEETKTIVNNWICEHKEAKIKKFTFAIELKDENQFIGLIALNLAKEKYRMAEVWYKLQPNFWNEGFATESLKKVLEFGFKNMNLHRIEAGCAVANIGSIRTMEKVGMKREGRKRKVLPLKSGWSDTFEYAILATD